MKEKVDKANTFDKADQFQHPKTFKNAVRILLVLSYNQNAPNVSKIKLWSILQIKEAIQKAFTKIPIVSFTRRKTLRKVLGGNTIVNGKVKKKQSIKATT